MRAQLRRALACVCILISGMAAAQSVKISGTGKHVRFGLRELQDGNTRVAGQGFQVPGIDLSDDRNARHRFGDDTLYAARSFVDTAWVKVRHSEDSVVVGNTVHWVRYHLRPEHELRGLPLMLHLEVRGPITAYLNGERVFHSPGMSLPSGDLLPASDSVPDLTLPISLLCDGEPEILALRISTTPGATLSSTGLNASLHAGDNNYRVQSRMVHSGVFIGVNLIILLLAFVIGWSERGDRSWALLAWLSLVSALNTICDLGGVLGTLGLPSALAHALDQLGDLCTPWSMYLLIMVLAVMAGDLTPKRAKRYRIGIAALTLIVIASIVADRMGMIDTQEGFSLVDATTLTVVLLVVLGALFAGIMIWFVIVLIRSAFRLMRSKGYERWVGVGAVASSLLTVLLAIISQLTGTGLGNWLSVIASYCSDVAVPVSVAVYLAIRSAHHNKLVTRQRDELDQEVKDRTAQLRTEKERSDELLLNILPHEVAEELKRTGAAAAKHFDQATVLFTDFRGFTQLSEQVSPAELVQELNTCFKVFDGLMDKYRIEKIKTIGDSYMAAGGLPDPGQGGPADVVHAALEMQAFMRRHRTDRLAQGLPVFEMRVGIHTGPVVAGIVGVKKFAYDIWGDTVNTASRIESSGEPGHVNISGSTYALVKEVPGLAFTSRGKVQAKGKGELEMYFVDAAN